MTMVVMKNIHENGDGVAEGLTSSVLDLLGYVKSVTPMWLTFKL